MENPGNELAIFLDQLHAKRYNYRNSYLYKTTGASNSRMTQIIRVKNLNSGV